VTVKPVAADPNASISVNGTQITSGATSANIPLTEGQTTNITIQVTAQDGTVNTYTIAVARATSSNANLTTIGQSKGGLSPVFAQATTSYTLAVNNTVSSITVAPVTADANATLMVNGTSQASGATSGTITLPEGQTTNISIQVTAQD